MIILIYCNLAKIVLVRQRSKLGHLRNTAQCVTDEHYINIPMNLCVGARYKEEGRMTDRERADLNAAKEALKAIAGYEREYGCCPYGCDCPSIAKDTLKQLENQKTP